jgi:PKD repeat protein
MFRNMTIGGGIKYLILLATFTLFVTGCADAGRDQSVNSNTVVTLDASASKPDFNGEIKKYHWKQVKGKIVQLSDKKSIMPTFTAPSVQVDTVLVFRLTTVEKGGYHSSWKTRDRVSITVKPSTSSNMAPTAKAEVNASSIKYGDSVTFDAHASTDSDGQIVSYEWKDENAVTLSSEVQFNYIFDTTGNHTITLTVTDDDGEASTDSVIVVVQELQNPTAVIHTSTNAVAVGQSVIFDANASSDVDGQIDVLTLIQTGDVKHSQLK